MKNKNWQTRTTCIFLLSREAHDLPQKALASSPDSQNPAGSLLRFYGVSPELGGVEILIEGERPYFYVPSGTQIPESPFFYTRQQAGFKNFEMEEVERISFSSQRDLLECRQTLHAKGIRTYEADISPAERFLMEKKIYAQANVTGLSREEKGLTLFLNPSFSPCESPVNLTVASVDIETGVRSGELYSIALYFTGKNLPDRAHILMLSKKSAPVPSSPEIEFLKSERELISRFLSLVQEIDPDILAGWNVVSFDLLFLKKKASDLKIPFLLGRGRKPAFIKERPSGGHFAVIPGRAVLDGPVFLRSSFYSFEDYSLETAAQKILGEGKRIGPGEDKIAEIERMFAEDPAALADYNLQDAVLVSKILHKTGLVDLWIKRSQISGLLWDQIGLSTAAFDHFFLPKIHSEGFVAGNVEDVRLTEHAAGGYVMDPQSGLYDDVLVFDFKSLYPSIICTFNIDPLSRLLANLPPSCGTNPETDSETLSTPKGFRFSRKTDFLAGFIKELLQKRQVAALQKDKPLSQAIKILMNSFYGVMGSAGCRFYHPDLPSAITSTGQWILIESRQWFESQGGQVLYGDTDSLFVRLPSLSSGFAERGQELAGTLTRYWAEKIHKDFRAQSYLEVKFEKYYRKFLLPRARNGEGGAKKRYAGLIANEGKEMIEFVGMEAVRSDWTQLAKDFQHELYMRIFYGREIRSWLKEFLTEIKLGRHDAKLIYKKRLRKSLAEYEKNVPPHVKAARQMASPGRQIHYVITRHGPVPIEKKPFEIDYDHYIQKQIRPVADSILGFLGLSFDEMSQPKQFDFFQNLLEKPSQND